MTKKGKGRRRKRNIAAKSQSKDDDEALICAHCNESFLQTEDFEIHIDQSHTQACPSCDLHFVTEDQLHKHLGDLHGEVRQKSQQLGTPRPGLSDQVKDGLSGEGDVQRGGRVSGEQERIDEAASNGGVTEENYENFGVESPVPRVWEEEEDRPESLEGDGSGEGIVTESPEEEGLVNSSEGRVAKRLDQRGDCPTEELENELPEVEAELATTICPECAPVLQRMVANIERRVLHQLQEYIVKSQKSS